MPPLARLASPPRERDQSRGLGFEEQDVSCSYECHPERSAGAAVPWRVQGCSDANGAKLKRESNPVAYRIDRAGSRLSSWFLLKASD
jgi:hypothetical protein